MCIPIARTCPPQVPAQAPLKLFPGVEASKLTTALFSRHTTMAQSMGVVPRLDLPLLFNYTTRRLNCKRKCYVRFCTLRCTLIEAKYIYILYVEWNMFALVSLPCSPRDRGCLLHSQNAVATGAFPRFSKVLSAYITVSPYCKRAGRRNMTSCFATSSCYSFLFVVREGLLTEGEILRFSRLLSVRHSHKTKLFGESIRLAQFNEK